MNIHFQNKGTNRKQLRTSFLVTKSRCILEEILKNSDWNSYCDNLDKKTQQIEIHIRVPKFKKSCLFGLFWQYSLKTRNYRDGGRSENLGWQIGIRCAGAAATVVSLICQNGGRRPPCSPPPAGPCFRHPFYIVKVCSVQSLTI